MNRVNNVNMWKHFPHRTLHTVNFFGRWLLCTISLQTIDEVSGACCITLLSRIVYSQLVQRRSGLHWGPSKDEQKGLHSAFRIPNMQHTCNFK